MAVAELPLSLLGQDTPGLLADNEEECFDVVNDDNQIIGCEKRSHVHATGLKHRAVYCFVFNQQRELLMQQRSPGKKIGPLQWDLSVAEHLQPGESYREVDDVFPLNQGHAQAASRGLQEELGISASAASLKGPLVPVHLRQLRVPEMNVTDCEFVTSFRLDNWQGEVIADPAEVHSWKFAGISDIQTDMKLHPDDYTAWFKAEIHAIAATDHESHS